MNQDIYEVVKDCETPEDAIERSIFKVGNKAIVSRLHVTSSGKDYVVIPQFSLVPDNSDSYVHKSQEPTFLDISDHKRIEAKSSSSSLNTSSSNVNLYLVRQRIREEQERKKSGKQQKTQKRTQGSTLPTK